MSLSLLLGGLGLIIAGGVVVAGTCWAVSMVLRGVVEQASSLAVRVVSETVGSIGPLVAREVGDQIRGYPMVALTEDNSNPQSDEAEVPSWYAQALGEDEEEFADPTDGLVPDEVDWRPEARVAGFNDLPEALRGQV